MNAQEGTKAKCARCHRPMVIRKEGQIYGPTCARKVAERDEALVEYVRAQPVVIV